MGGSCSWTAALCTTGQHPCGGRGGSSPCDKRGLEWALYVLRGPELRGGGVFRLPRTGWFQCSPAGSACASLHIARDATFGQAGRGRGAADAMSAGLLAGRRVVPARLGGPASRVVSAVWACGQRSSKQQGGSTPAAQPAGSNAGTYEPRVCHRTTAGWQANRYKTLRPEEAFPELSNSSHALIQQLPSSDPASHISPSSSHASPNKRGMTTRGCV